MTSLMATDPTQVCEDVLLEERRYNEEHNIWPSQNKIIDRLLARRVELIDAYAEIHAKLHSHPHALKEFFRAVTYAGVSWNPARNLEARATRDRLIDINQRIAEVGRALAALLEERSELENGSSFHAHGFYHIGEVIEAASAGNYLFDSYLREPLHALRAQFDFKYWPSLAACAAALAQDAMVSQPGATDAVTEVATRASRASKADFFKALYANINEYGAGGYGCLPRGLRLTDETIASIANCVLDLSADSCVDGAYVKRLRQREREVKA